MGKLSAVQIRNLKEPGRYSDGDGLIRDVLAPIWLTKPETARRVRQRIGAVLDWAYAKGFRASEAPIRSLARGLPRQPKKRGHFEAMPYEEVPDFVAELRSRVSVGRLALEFLILTATRSGEVRSCAWSELDLKRGLWTIPADRMKAGKEHIVPLTASAIDVLARVRLFRSPAKGDVRSFASKVRRFAESGRRRPSNNVEPGVPFV